MLISQPGPRLVTPLDLLEEVLRGPGGHYRHTTDLSPPHGPIKKKTKELSGVHNDTVPTGPFLSAMEARWASFGNVSSPRLLATWRQIAETFNRKVLEHQTPNHSTWYVLEPATGTGKSESTKVYAALSTNLAVPPGILVVTRLKAECDLMASDINALAGRGVAVARHSDTEVPPRPLSEYPVLCITHEAYKRALESHDWDREGPWDALVKFEDGQRRLIVIDEAVDTIEIASLNRDTLRQLLGFIPEVVRGQFPAEVLSLEVLLQTFNHLDSLTAGDDGEARILVDDWDVLSGESLFQKLTDLGPLRQAMKQHRYIGSAKKKTDEDLNRKLAAKYDSIFGRAQALMRYFVVYRQDGPYDSLNTARLLVPPWTQGCVVLDATAGVSPLYDAMDHVVPLRPPRGARSYRNVRLHISRGHRVGKSTMVAEGKEHADALISDLSERIPAGSQVFVCVHQAAEQHYVGTDAPFEILPGHWGAVDGSNCWRDCDTAVIASLPYRDPMDAALSFFALQGVQKGEWLQDETRRIFKRHRDIKLAIETGWVVSSVIQAVNRIRCRRVNDADGNCPNAEVYLLLPAGNKGEAIEAGILEAMPGIQVCQWEHKARKRKPKRTKHEDILATFIRGIAPGAKWSASAIKAELGIPSRTWDRLVPHLRDLESGLGQVLAERGIAYTVDGAGRSQRAYLVR